MALEDLKGFSTVLPVAGSIDLFTQQATGNKIYCNPMASLVPQSFRRCKLIQVTSQGLHAEADVPPYTCIQGLCQHFMLSSDIERADTAIHLLEVKNLFR